MSDTSVGRLRELVEEFRQALEATSKSDLPYGLIEFPRGSCDDASQLLAAYLADQGFDGIRLIAASRGAGEDWHSHNWLRYGSVDIDLTADQFTDAPAPVIVEANSEWHRVFRRAESRTADFREHIDDGWRSEAMRGYRAILATLRAAT